MLLRNLDLVYPSGLTASSLYQTVCGIDETYDFGLFTKDVFYLKQKDYIYFVDDAIGGGGEFKKRTVKLTYQGKEIAEQTMTDKALEI